MNPIQDRLTLEALLSDPLTRLVMRSDNVTVDETARAFGDARAAIFRHRLAALNSRPFVVRRSGSALCGTV